MLYLETGSSDVYYNFALEYYLCSVAQKDEMIFMFWRTEPTLMIGKYQNPYEEINMEYVKNHDVAIARRLSGGGTIYTDLGGWQFTFIDPNGAEEIEFAKYIKPILQALNALGVPVTFTGRNDFLLDGKKISGNAQYKLNGYTVHHGSLLFDTDIEAIVRSTTVDPGKIISKSIQSVRDRVTNISQYLAKPISGEEFKCHMLKQMTDGRELKLSAEEIKQVEKIADQHFRSKQAIFGNTPKFTNESEKRFPSGLVKVQVNVQKGKIKEIKFSGDYFATADFEQIAPALTGVHYEEESILNALHSAIPENTIYGISFEELTELILGLSK